MNTDNQSNLTDEQKRILVDGGTEPPFSSSLNDEKRVGVFRCAACGAELFKSEHKYDSGSGWPSFYKAAEDAIETKDDRKLMITRTEVRCAACGSHQGHVFNDGPEPTGKRYCINGAALDFEPKEQ